MFPVIPKSQPVELAAIYKNVFNEKELDLLEAQAALAKETGGADKRGQDIRRSKIMWFPVSGETAWVYERIAGLVADANALHFRFDLNWIVEPIQLARYEEQDKGHYDWHQDLDAAHVRKISVTVQLTDSSAYEGGQFELHTVAKAPPDALSSRGTGVVFPSFQMHRVAPVTRGVRHSLVA